MISECLVIQSQCRLLYVVDVVVNDDDEGNAIQGTDDVRARANAPLPLKAAARRTVPLMSWRTFFIPQLVDPFLC